jgi:probable rRNA maturation factor
MNRAPRGRLPPERSVEIVIESPLWKTIPSVKTPLRRAIGLAWPTDLGEAEVAILLTDDTTVRALNQRWRGTDEPTNVLSFPSRRAGRDHGAPVFLGDIVIAYETSAREAAAEGKPLHHHLTHLAVHGFLHLVGYDHESDADAESMESLERKVLAQLGIGDPYAPSKAKGFNAE